MFRDTHKRAILYLMAIIALVGSVTLFSVAMYDFGRGSQNVVESVPICQTSSCQIMPQGAAGELMDIFDRRSALTKDSRNNSSASSWLGMTTENMCSLPERVLKKYRPSESLSRVNNVFSALGLSEITQDKGNWVIKPGRAVDSVFDTLRKMSDPFFADYSCYKPHFRYYSFAILGLFWMALYLLKKARRIGHQRMRVPFFSRK